MNYQNKHGNFHAKLIFVRFLRIWTNVRYDVGQNEKWETSRIKFSVAKNSNSLKRTNWKLRIAKNNENILHSGAAVDHRKVQVKHVISKWRLQLCAESEFSPRPGKISTGRKMIEDIRAAGHEMRKKERRGKSCLHNGKLFLREDTNYENF